LTYRGDASPLRGDIEPDFSSRGELDSTTITWLRGEIGSANITPRGELGPDLLRGDSIGEMLGLAELGDASDEMEVFGMVTANGLRSVLGGIGGLKNK
jgi:hypothetical protein